MREKHRNTIKYLRRPPNTNHQHIVSIETVGLRLANTTTLSRTRLNILSNNPTGSPTPPTPRNLYTRSSSAPIPLPILLPMLLHIPPQTRTQSQPLQTQTHP